MSKFKVGDRVVCISEDHYYFEGPNNGSGTLYPSLVKKGAEFTVQEVNEFGIMRLEKNFPNWYFPQNFKLVPDKVIRALEKFGYKEEEFPSQGWYRSASNLINIDQLREIIKEVNKK